MRYLIAFTVGFLLILVLCLPGLTDTTLIDIGGHLVFGHLVFPVWAIEQRVLPVSLLAGVVAVFLLLGFEAFNRRSRGFHKNITSVGSLIAAVMLVCGVAWGLLTNWSVK